MSRIFLRTLSSIPPTPSAGPSQPNNVLSTLPLAVRRRRAQYPNVAISRPSPLLSQLPHAPTEPDAAFSEGSEVEVKVKGPAKRFPLKLEQEFQNLRTKGQYKGDEASARKAFLKSNVAWRSRVRGVSVKKMDHLLRGVPKEIDAVVVEDGEVTAEGSTSTSISTSKSVTSSTSDAIVGQRIYLPNIQIRLVRNHTPPGEAYDPTIATFRIPQGMTKTDLRSYLSAVYDLPVTFIRTDNYFSEVGRKMNGVIARQKGSMENYKRAIVGLVEPFHYPDDVEELYAQGRAAGVGDTWGKAAAEWMEERFMADRVAEYQIKAKMKMYKGYRWRSKTHANEGNTIREIMRRRQEREDKIRVEASKLLAQRDEMALAA